MVIGLSVAFRLFDHLWADVVHNSKDKPNRVELGRDLVEMHRLPSEDMGYNQLEREEADCFGIVVHFHDID